MNYSEFVKKLTKLLNSLELQGRPNAYDEVVQSEIKIVLEDIEKDPYIGYLVKDVSETNIEQVKNLCFYIQKKLFELSNRSIITEITKMIIENENLQNRIHGLSTQRQFEDFSLIQAPDLKNSKFYVKLPYDFNYDNHGVSANNPDTAFDIVLGYTVSQNGMVGETYYQESSLNTFEESNNHFVTLLNNLHLSRNTILKNAVSDNKLVKTAIIEFDKTPEEISEILDDLVYTMRESYSKQKGVRS